MDDTMSLKQRFCTFWGTFNESHPDLKMTLSIAFFVVFLFYLLEIVREVIDEWEVTVGTRGQWVVLLFTLFLAVWVADPWGTLFQLWGQCTHNSGIHPIQSHVPVQLPSVAIADIVLCETRASSARRFSPYAARSAPFNSNSETQRMIPTGGFSLPCDHCSSAWLRYMCIWPESAYVNFPIFRSLYFRLSPRLPIHRMSIHL